MTINDEYPPTPAPEIAQDQPALPPGDDEGAQPLEPQEMTPEQRRTMIVIIIVVILIVVFIIGSIFWLSNQPPSRVAQIRDIFIIWMAIMSLLTGIALVILMVQLARLMNLLQNELQPILESLNETISYLRGTSVFLSDNVSEPVIKANEYVAGISQFFKILGLTRRRPKSSSSNKTKEKE